MVFGRGKGDGERMAGRPATTLRTLELAQAINAESAETDEDKLNHSKYPVSLRTQITGS